MRELGSFVAATLLAAALSGCADQGGPANASPTVSDPYALPEGVTNVLQGQVRAEDLAPLGNATVAVISLQINQTTDEAGAFRFENLEPRDYLVTVTKDGYRTKTQRAIIEDGKIYELNFTLEVKPNVTPYSEVLSFKGRISCQVAYASNPDQHDEVDCGAADPVNNHPTEEFFFQPGGAQLVVEAFWTPAQRGAERLRMSVESVGFGHQDIVFGEVVGPTGLKLPISQSLMGKYYPQGGTVRVTMTAAPGLLGQPESYDAGAAVQQDFELWVTVFYYEPGPPNYSAQKQ